MDMKVYAAVFVSALMLVDPGVALAEPPLSGHFMTHLSGREEVPPNETRATGQFTSNLDDAGTELAYRLIAANIENVVAAHIHLGAAGVNGPVVAFLAGPFPPGGGLVNGVLAEGTVTADDLVGPLVGQDLSVLVQAMRTGGAYVNVHTNDGVAPINTGPGDLPGGEIRGQVRSAPPAR